jgi:hypothetical protein
LVQDAKREAAALMRDPASTTFENVTEYPDQKVVCGELNSKNAYGAYAGLEAFVYRDGDVILESDTAFAQADGLCKLKGEESRRRMLDVSNRLSREVNQAVQDLKDAS